MKRQQKMTRIGLSIDFDFFVRELKEWEWGHSEESPIYSNGVWAARYVGQNLYEECSLDHADFRPEDLLWQLHHRGVQFPEGGVDVGVADSHRFGFEWFEKREDFDEIVHLDAHHDAFEYYPDSPSHDLNCGNWLTALGCVTRNAKKPVTAVYPSWKDPKIDGPPNHPRLKIVKWPKFRLKKPGVITSVLLVRSGAWVPPHLDKEFMRLYALLSVENRIKDLEPIYARDFPSEETVRENVTKFDKLKSKIMAENIKNLKKSKSLSGRKKK